jgi:hypothetical protein
VSGPDALRVGLIVLAAVAVAGTPAAGASLALTDGERQAALRLGEKSVFEDSFGGEWRVANAAGENLTVMTPFHRLALAARHAAFKNEPLKPEEPDKLLNEQKDRLIFDAELRGPRPDFAVRLRPELVVDGHTIKPAFLQNERSALRRDGAYVARCRYAFPTKELTGVSRASLVVRDPAGREASTFMVDLAKMR